MSVTLYTLTVSSQSTKVIIQQGSLDPVGAQHYEVTEWLRSVLSIWVPLLKYFPRISKVFREIFRNILKYISKISEIFLEIFRDWLHFDRTYLSFLYTLVAYQ